jgi:hypothetical protein
MSGMAQTGTVLRDIAPRTERIAGQFATGRRRRMWT